MAWILDGLEITIASSASGKLTQANILNLSTTQASAIGTVYLVGEVVGALVFGRLSDKLGRRFPSACRRRLLGGLLHRQILLTGRP